MIHSEPKQRSRKAPALLWVLNTAVLAVAGLSLIPALVEALGTAQWSNIAVGQALGGLVGVIAGFGWGISGPVRVARADKQARYTEYLRSLVVRGLIAVLAVFLATAVACSITRSWSWAMLFGVAAVTMIGCGPSWYFVGRGMPLQLLCFDTTARVAGTVAAIALARDHAPGALILGTQTAGVILGTAISSVFILKHDTDRSRGALSPRSVKDAILSQVAGVTAAAISSAYAAAPLALVSALFSPSLTAYAVFDKVEKQFASAVSPVVQVLQGHLGRAREQDLAVRARTAALLVVGASVGGIAIFTVVGPYFLSWLVDGRLHFHLTSVIFVALTLATTLVEQTLSRAFMPRVISLRRLPLASGIGALSGIGLMLVLTGRFGAVGAVIGDVTGITVTIILELAILRPAIRSVLA